MIRAMCIHVHMLSVQGGKLSRMRTGHARLGWLLLSLALSMALLIVPTAVLAEQDGPPETSPQTTHLRLPFPAGSGQILGGYSARSHTGGDEYAIDFCQGQGCIQSAIGDYVIAPANMMLVMSMRGYGHTRYDDYHIFQALTDDREPLCVSLGHFSIELPGLGPGAVVKQGVALGRIGPYRDSIPHIHMGIWRVPQGCSCASYERTPLPFVGELALDGQTWPAEIEPQDRIVSSNMAQCLGADDGDTLDCFAGQMGDDAEFVGDVTIPDETYVKPDSAFRKTWRLRNTGSSTWTSDYSLALIDGERLGSPRMISVPWDVAPGQELEITAYLTAPSIPGTWRSDWRLVDDAGHLFGDSMWVIVSTGEIVESPPTIW